MIKRVLLGSALFLGLSVAVGLIGLNSASACNKTAGCVMDTLHESHAMMQNGKMSAAMSAGQDNIEAFRRLQEAERGASAGAPKR